MHGYKLHVMTHAPYQEDKSSLPNSVYVLKTYTKLKDSSQNVSVVLRNLTGKTIHLAPRQVHGLDSRSQRGSRSHALTGVGQGVGGNPSKGGPQAYCRRATETPYGVVMTRWWTGTAEGVATGTGPEI